MGILAISGCQALIWAILMGLCLDLGHFWGLGMDFFSDFYRDFPKYKDKMYSVVQIGKSREISVNVGKYW